MNIREFFIIVLRNWHVFLLAIFVSAALALSASFLITPHWESEATIRIGMIGGKPIESTSELIYRIRSTGTIKNVLIRNDVEVTQKNILALRSNTRLISSGTDSIEIRVRSEGAQSAKSIVEHYFNEIQKQHTQMSALELSTVNDEYKRIQQINIKIVELMTSNKEKKSIATSSLSDLTRAQLLFQSEEKLSVLAQKLLPPMSIPTQLQSPIDGMPDPVTPNRPLITILGALIGLAIALIHIFSSKK